MVEMGNGEKAKFWEDKWLEVDALKIVSQILQIVK